MTFLHPILLAALPVILLPVVIHLINQRRYQTIRWAAMMFLLAANRMSRGYARLRQWLIMAFRMAALAGLIFSVSRPLASGWLGLAAGGGADTTIVLLDRSPSMQQIRPGTEHSKLTTGRQQLVRALETLRSQRWVLIDSATNTPREIESPTALASLTTTEATSTSADLPTMLEAARDYIQANRPGRTEIWICSDLRKNDWNAEDSRWSALRESFAGFTQGVRFHLLAYPEIAPDNLAVRVTDVRRRETPDHTELLVSLRLTRDDDGSRSTEARRTTVPVQFEIEGARSETTVELTGTQFDLKDHRLTIDKTKQRGWGRVSLPADANPADNRFYFVFDQPAVRQTAIVTDDAAAATALVTAASISPDPAVRCQAEVFAPEQTAALAWDQTALVLWQAPLPTGDAAKLVDAYVRRGGQVIFFPPKTPGSESFAGIAWQAWQGLKEDAAVATWRPDQDLLANTQSGSPLPLAALQIRRYCMLAGDHTPLATLPGKAPLLARATTPRGGVYFCTTTPSPSDSSLASNGIVLYVLLQRAMAAGAAVLGNTRQVVAGDLGVVASETPQNWRQVAGASNALSTDYAYHAGVYGAEERLFAVNAGAAEEQAAKVEDQRVAELFAGLDFKRIDDTVGNLSSLINEIWRLFLAAMIIALIVEAALCLPKVTPAPPPGIPTAASFAQGGSA